MPDKVYYTFKTLSVPLYSLCPEHSQDSPALAGLSLWEGLLYKLHLKSHAPVPAQETQCCFDQIAILRETHAVQCTEV